MVRRWSLTAHVLVVHYPQLAVLHPLLFAGAVAAGVDTMSGGAWVYRHPQPTGAGWSGGPASPCGSKVDLSDRNLLCMSIHGDTAVGTSQQQNACAPGA